MSQRVLLDTGPLVAFLNRRDQHHAWAVEQLGALRPPLWTSESVLSEACFLLQQVHPGSEAVLALVERGLLRVAFRIAEEHAAVRRLMVKYRDVPASLADACLVRMAEQHSDSVVLTLDGDFRIYRRNGRQVIPLLTPGGGFPGP